MRIFKLIVVSMFLIFWMTSCRTKKISSTDDPSRDLKQITHSDTLKVATMYGSTSYFLFRDEYLGFDYEMAENLAAFLHVKLELTIAQTPQEMTQWLEQGKVDLVASNMIQTKALKEKFNFVFPQNESYLVLVQNMGANSLSDVTQLAGKEVYVNSNTIFHERLKSLNEEIGGNIKIKIASDSLSTDDLIDMVSENKISYTLAYHNVALLHKAHNKSLDVHMSVGFEQHNGWIIRKQSSEFNKSIENWIKQAETTTLQDQLFHKYWESSPYFSLRKVKIPRGAISPFDNLFKKYAPQISWDWRLLAALAYHESRFDNSQVSWAGASGLMQLMPRTAANFGLDNATKFDPERNIEAGVQYIKSLNMSFRQVENNEERMKFILAAYNSGPAHILDAMALAKKFGKNPHLWFDNVEYFLLKKSEPQFYNDPVVKYGVFRGKETVKYVQNTLDTYQKYMKKK